jgi:hypothetical protein
MFTLAEISDADESVMMALAGRLRPHLAAQPAPAPAKAPSPLGLSVAVARMNKNQTGGSTLAYCDLTFFAAGVELMTVHGFKWMTKADGSRWLSVPREKRVKNVAGEVVEEWQDSFKWAPKGILADIARQAVSEHYGAPAEIPLGE